MLKIQIDQGELYNRQLFGLNPSVDNFTPNICHRDLGENSSRHLIQNHAISLKIDLAKDID